MKLKYPNPEKAEIIDETLKDNEPDPRLPFDIDAKPRLSFVTLNAQEASERMTRLHQQGLSLRAVVVGKMVMDKFNPKNWGVITDTFPFDPFPLEVRFVATSAIARSNGSELEVIFRGMSKVELAEYLNPNRSIQ